MTNSFTKLRRAGLMLAIAFTVSAVSSSPSFAVSAEIRAACTPDVYRVCSDAIPSLSKITSCMVARRTQLSPNCRSLLDKEIAARSGKVATND
jgi:hypothetical protein